MAGRFITFEGVEGVGKSTQIRLAAQTLESLGAEVELTREPGGTPLAEDIRELLLANREESMAATTELLLMFAARAQHLERLILPRVTAGRWVLCDRFTDATFAYQGYGRGLSLERIAQLEQWVQGDFRPHHVILLDAPVEIGMARALKRSGPDRFEQEALDFFERIRAGYLARASAAPDRYHVIDADAPLETVTAAVQEVIRTLYDRHRSQ